MASILLFSKLKTVTISLALMSLGAATTIIAFQAKLAQAASNPIGVVETATCTNISGWAWDPDAPNEPIDIHVYLDGPAGRGNILARITANQNRLDIAKQTKDNGLHGFTLNPLRFASSIGGTRKVYVYGIDKTGDRNVALNQGDPILMTCPQKLGDATISKTVFGNQLTITTTERLAGAIDLLEWKGKQFLNSLGKGRSIQTAWTLNGYGECYNPTEAGSIQNAALGNSSSQLLSFQATNDSFTSIVKPAFFLPPGYDMSKASCQGTNKVINDTLVSEEILEKTVQIGYEDLENVIHVQSTLKSSQNYQHLRVESLAAHLMPEFDRLWYYNFAERRLKEASGTQLVSRFSDRSTKTFQSDDPAIISTSDQQYALGVYALQSDDYENIDYHMLDVKAPGYSATTKWSTVHLRGFTPQGNYQFETFIVVGNLDQVKNTIQQLYDRKPKLSVVKNLSGSIIRNDDFNDNTLSSSVWGFQNAGVNVSAQEVNGELRIAGNNTLPDQSSLKISRLTALQEYTLENDSVEFSLDYKINSKDNSTFRFTLNSVGAQGQTIETLFMKDGEHQEYQAILNAQNWYHLGYADLLGNESTTFNTVKIRYNKQTKLVEFYLNNKKIGTTYRNLGDRIKPAIEVVTRPGSQVDLVVDNFKITEVGNGTVTTTNQEVNCGSDCLEPYNRNTLVTLEAQPDRNSQFLGWSGCDEARGKVCRVTMDQVKTVTANFGLAQK